MINETLNEKIREAAHEHYCESITMYELVDAMNTAAKLALESNWISVSKGSLPNGDDTILVYLTDRKGSSAIRHVYYKNGIWRDVQTDGDVEFYEGLLATHWQPLPIPPSTKA